MAGIYIHVPFCKTRCIYCDFFTQTAMQQRADYIDALCKEIELRKAYLDNEIISTIYLGGGTPSLLSIKELGKILATVKSAFEIAPNPEITLEANPDDLLSEYLDQLIEVGFNRLSVGIQSFDDTELAFLNRRHSAQKAIEAIKLAQIAGFHNISIDLMYGLPNQSLERWHKNLETAIGLNIQHISAYHLIYEEGTQLFRLLENGKVSSADENLSVEMFSTMIDQLNSAEFIHYEISNFAKVNFLSQHNSSYWKGVKYLGLGPSAHSFNGASRCWNVASIDKYIEGINNNIPDIETEVLDIKTRYNDYILTGLRTMWGINKLEIKSTFGENMLLHCENNIKKYLNTNHITTDGDNYKISRQGIFISDSIISNLMFV